MISSHTILFDSKTPLSEYLYNEYLFTNGLGGYSSTSLSGTTTRKYHGLLVSALPAPYGRQVFLNYLKDRILCEGKPAVNLSFEDQEELSKPPYLPLREFRLENGFPIWLYQWDDIYLEKRIFMTYRQNSVHVVYTYLQGSKPIQIEFRPYLHFRHHEAPVSIENNSYTVLQQEKYFEILKAGFPSLKICANKEIHYKEEASTLSAYYRLEDERGYEKQGNLNSPGHFSAPISPSESITFTASTEPWAQFEAFSNGLKEEVERKQYLILEAKKVNSNVDKDPQIVDLILAADQFIIIPKTRPLDIAWTQAVGEEARTIIAGYHWFTDWGRDTMISLEGLTLVTGRYQEAEYILRTFAHHIREGLIPNMFPDGESVGVYHTADATLWFFHALDRYCAYTQNYGLVEFLLPKLIELVEKHIAGTSFGIHVDLDDGLLIQGQEGYALTWMDAKVGDLVVTPRRGKAVEINALWYNALCLLVEWLEKFSTNAEKYKTLASQCKSSFNQKFWNEASQCFYDVINKDEKDAACRPNQLFALSLKYPIAAEEYWRPTLETVKQKLLTPYGLRTLSREHSDFKVVYKGNLFVRDSAYHQGTIWPWLIGPYIDAWLRVYPNKISEITNVLEDLNRHILQGCCGSINEIFDATDPYNHRGCIAQAWSVAEVLRSKIKLLS